MYWRQKLDKKDRPYEGPIELRGCSPQQGEKCRAVPGDQRGREGGGDGPQDFNSEIRKPARQNRCQCELQRRLGMPRSRHMVAHTDSIASITYLILLVKYCKIML